MMIARSSKYKEDEEAAAVLAPWVNDMMFEEESSIGDERKPTIPRTSFTIQTPFENEKIRGEYQHKVKVVFTLCIWQTDNPFRSRGSFRPSGCTSTCSLRGRPETHLRFF